MGIVPTSSIMMTLARLRNAAVFGCLPSCDRKVQATLSFAIHEASISISSSSPSLLELNLLSYRPPRLSHSSISTSLPSLLSSNSFSHSIDAHNFELSRHNTVLLSRYCLSLVLCYSSSNPLLLRLMCYRPRSSHMVRI